MNKNIKLLIIFGVSSSVLGILPFVNHSFNAKAEEASIYHVDFYNNYKREDFTLSSGLTGKGNSLLFKTIDVTKDSLIPSFEGPTRRNYDFAGWYKESTCENAWKLSSDKVNSNTRLYAKWTVKEASDIVEPTYTPPSTVLEESAATDYVINSIMNFKISDGQVKLSRSALSKLDANKDNVLPLMEYKVKASKTMTATYSDNKITVTCNGNNEVINVKDDTATYKLDNSSYEAKALKYEEKALEEDSYHVMLAGSSSIEFWETSKQDLDPIVSFNHGIGGTTIEEWTTKLNQRLVYPYKPKMVVYYVGINNVINSKESASTIIGHLTTFFNETHANLPDTKVQYILMNQLPGYKGYKDVIDTVNNAAINYQKSNSYWLTLINPGLALLKENGEPNAAFFRTDGLHLSRYGYTIWGGIIKESIINGLENM